MKKSGLSSFNPFSNRRPWKRRVFAQAMSNGIFGAHLIGQHDPKESLVLHEEFAECCSKRVSNGIAPFLFLIIMRPPSEHQVKFFRRRPATAAVFDAELGGCFQICLEPLDFLLLEGPYVLRSRVNG